MKNMTILRHAAEAAKVFLDHQRGRDHGQPDCTDEVLAEKLGLSLPETVRRVKLGLRIETAWVMHTIEKKTLAEIAFYERSDTYPFTQHGRGRRSHIPKEAYPKVNANTVDAWLTARAQVHGIVPRPQRGRPRKGGANP